MLAEVGITFLSPQSPEQLRIRAVSVEDTRRSLKNGRGARLRERRLVFANG